MVNRHSDSGSRPSNRVLSDDDADVDDDDVDETTFLKASDMGTYTLEDALNSIGVGKFQKWFLLPICGVALFAEGSYAVHVALLTGIAKKEFGVGPLMASLLMVLLFGGSMVGGLLWGPVGDRWGRRIAYLFSTIVCFVAGIGSSLVANYWMLLGTVFFVGVGMAGIVVSVSLFGEFLTTKTRSFMMMLLMGFWSLGSVCQAAAAWALIPMAGWRVWVGLSALPFLFALVMFPLLPESPRWLVTTGRYDQAVGVLGRLTRWNQGKSLPPGKLVYANDLPKGSTWDLLKGKYLVTSVLLSIISYISFISYFGVSILMVELFRHDKADKIQSTDSKELSHADYEDIVIVTSAELPGLVLMGMLMDCLGRRWSISVSSILSGALLLCFLNDGVNDQAAERTILFIIRAFLFGVANVVMIYNFEVFPTSVRATGMSLMYICSRIGALSSSPVMEELFAIKRIYPAVTFGSLLLFSGMLACCLPIETKSKPLQASIEPRKANKAVKTGGDEKL